MLSVILFLVVNLKWVWQLAHHNITFSLCNIVFSAVHWAQMPRLFPPWPLHKAPGGPCASRWRAFLWSLLCCLTKLLSRYSPQSFIFTTCSAVFVQNWHWVINVVLLMSSGPARRWWCCGKIESFPGFAAVVQGEWVSLLVLAFHSTSRGSSTFCVAVTFVLPAVFW